MNDLISRQAAIDALARTAREKFNLSDEFDHYLAGLIDGENAIRQLPSAQPEVIRCGECKHRFTDGENVVYNVCELNHNKVQADDWYCADAERRTDE